MKEYVTHGVSFGSALAITISWSVHHSILWAILQGFLGWLYVVCGVAALALLLWATASRRAANSPVSNTDSSPSNGEQFT